MLKVRGVYGLPEEEESAPHGDSENCGVRAAFADAQDKATETDKQNELFTQILAAYKEYYKTKNSGNLTYKKVFFYAILSMLGVIILAFAAAGIILAVRGAAWRDALPLLGGGTAAVLTSLIILPQIIATHLFPVKEDQVIVDLIAVLRGTSPDPYGAPGGE